MRAPSPWNAVTESASALRSVGPRSLTLRSISPLSSAFFSCAVSSKNWTVTVSVFAASPQ